MKPTVIFVMGHPASGKTTLAKQLALELPLPLISKDLTLKEPMFDEFQTTSREWSIKIGRVAYKIMESLMQQQLRAGHSFVAESTFKFEYDNPTFVGLQQQYGFHAVQVICHAAPEVLARRFMDRIDSGERHPGHGHSEETYETVRDMLVAAGPLQPFELPGETMHIDTTSFDMVNVAEIVAKVRDTLH